MLLHTHCRYKEISACLINKDLGQCNTLYFDEIVSIKISNSKFYELHFAIPYIIILFTVKCESNWFFYKKSIRFKFAG